MGFNRVQKVPPPPASCPKQKDSYSPGYTPEAIGSWNREQASSSQPPLRQGLKNNMFRKEITGQTLLHVMPPPPHIHTASWLSAWSPCSPAFLSSPGCQSVTWLHCLAEPLYPHSLYWIPGDRKEDVSDVSFLQNHYSSFKVDTANNSSPLSRPTAAFTPECAVSRD